MLVSLLAALLLLLGCQNHESTTLPADYPLEKIIVRPSGRTLFYAAPSVSLEDLVDLSPLIDRGLQPGTNLRRIEARLGSPDYQTTDRQGRDDVYGYEVPEGLVEIVKQHVSSEGLETDRWFLRYRPAAGNSALHDTIVSYVTHVNPKPTEISVLAGPNRKSVVGLDFEGDTVTLIWWQA